MATAIIGIDGADGTGDPVQYAADYAGSFINRLVHGAGNGFYIQGPQVGKVFVEAKAWEAVNEVLRLRQHDPDIDIILAGYSLGGASAVMACQMLSGVALVTIECLALFDAIGVLPTEKLNLDVPANVRKTVHGYRNYATGSKPGWLNCARSAPNTFIGRSVWVTHWAASGVPQPVPQGKTLDSYVWEYESASGTELPTLVTYGQDNAGQQQLWQLVHGEVMRSVNKLKHWIPKPQPVPGPGQGNGGKTVTVVPGESLSLITQREWGDALLWPLLYETNASTIGANPNLIKPGMKLTVPKLNTWTQAEQSSARQRGVNC